MLRGKKKKITSLRFWLGLLAVGAWLQVSPVAADVYMGAGAGILHSENFAFQAAMPVFHPAIEAHFTAWKNGKSDRAYGLGYRFNHDGRVSLLFGASYISHITDELLRHGNAYIEIRVNLFRDVSCQVSHYSTIGDDSGENFLLCGVQFSTGSAP